MRFCSAGVARAAAVIAKSTITVNTTTTASAAQTTSRRHRTGCGCGSSLLPPTTSPLTSSAGVFSPSSTLLTSPHRGPTHVARATLSFSSYRAVDGAAVTAASSVQRRQCSTSTGSFADGSRPYVPGQTVQEVYPIVQLPARSLWCRQYALDKRTVAAGDYVDLIAQVKAARHYYQYPSMSAPQTGWNVQMFTLFDNSVFINPVNLDEEDWRAEAAAKKVPWVVFEEEKMRALRAAGLTGFAWEPCASCSFMMHYIERPLTVRVRALDEQGKEFTVELDKMRGRMALHELDHLQGVLFTRRVVDTDHVVPLEGFVTMSDWSDDYPSLEARSTFLYTLFTPPYTFTTDAVEDGNLLDRKFEDGVYPGCEQDRQLRIESMAAEELQRNQWRSEKRKQQEAMQQRTASEASAAGSAQEEEEEAAAAGDARAV